MIIDCIADLHGFYPKLEGGDLLIVAGDLTARGTRDEYIETFQHWLNSLDYKKKIIIAGNHDNLLQHGVSIETGYGIMKYIPLCDCDYLCDSGTEFEGLKIWGSPWTLTFPCINPRCTAFTGTEEDLKAKFDLIPDDIDILITHGPPYGILDQVYHPENCRYHHTGSKSLMDAIKRVEPKVSIFGHIHEEYGSREAFALETDFFNCSHVNEYYEPVNKPVRIIL